MDYNVLKDAIKAYVKDRTGLDTIDGDGLQETLLAMVNSLGAGYQFAGVAKLTPTQTDPGTPDQNVFYIAAEPGSYTNFPISGGYLQVAENEVAIFKYNGQWSKETTGAATAEAVSQLGQKLTVGYRYMGMLTPTMNPGSPDQRCFYFAVEPGTYFNGTKLPGKVLYICRYESSWLFYSTGIGLSTLGDYDNLFFPDTTQYNYNQYFQEIYINNALIPFDYDLYGRKVANDSSLNRFVFRVFLGNSEKFSCAFDFNADSTLTINGITYSDGDIVPVYVTETLSADVPLNTLLGYVVFKDMDGIAAVAANSVKVLMNKMAIGTMPLMPRISEYLAHQNSKIKISEIEPIDLQDVTFSEESANLINEEDSDFLLNKELNAQGQPIINTNPDYHKATSGFIPVAPGDKYVESYDGVAVANGNMLCYYDYLKRFVSYSVGAAYPITVPSGVAYMRLTSIAFEDLDRWQVEIGTQVTPYKQYGYFIPKKYLDADLASVGYVNEKVSDAVARGNVNIHLPSKIYCVVGDTLQLFYKSIFECIDPYQYDILVETNNTTTYDGHPSIQQFPRYIEINMPAATAGNTYTLSITIKDQNGNTLGQKTTSLVVAAAPTSPQSQTNILIVGDSTPRNGVMPDELQRRLVGNGGTPSGSNLQNVALVGRQVGTNPGSTAKCECGGGRWTSYTAENSDNPFYHNGVIDMDWYVDEYCDGKVDIILTTLFANGATTYGSNVSTLISQMATFINQCRNSTKLANVKFGIGLEFNYDIKGGLGAVYGSGNGWAEWYGMSVTHYAILEALEKWIEDNNAGDYVFILNLLNEFDCENGYPQHYKKLNVRMPDNPVSDVVEVVKEPFGSNGVHPHEYGRQMFADTCWRLIVSKYCQ